MSLSPQTQPTHLSSLHHLEQLARQRAEHYLHVGNYRQALKVADTLCQAERAVAFGYEHTARFFLNRASELTP